MKIGRLNRASFAKTARRVMLLFAFAALGAQAATVATVNGTGYETLEAAIAAAEPGSTVAVCEDIRQDKTLTIQEKDLTLDLNGKTLTVATEGDGIVVQDATLNLGNSGGTGKYVFECTARGSDGIYLYNTREDGGSILNINSNVEILFKPEVNSAIHAYGEAGTAVVNMNAGNVYAKGKGQRVSAVIIDQNAAFNMKGGTFDLNVDFDTFSQNNNDVVGVLVWGQNGVQKNGTVKIEGGSFNVGGKNAFAQVVQVGMKNGKSDNVSVEISGGEIVLSPSGDGEGYVFTPYNAAYASATMSGGRIRGTVTALTATASGADTANMIVSGGTFPFEVKESYCADGVTVKATTDADGNTVYGVVEKTELVNYVTLELVFGDNVAGEDVVAAKALYAGEKYETCKAANEAYMALFGVTWGNGYLDVTDNTAPLYKYAGRSGSVSEVRFYIHGTLAGFTSLQSSGNQIDCTVGGNHQIFRTSYSIIGVDGADGKAKLTDGNVQAYVAGGYASMFTASGKLTIDNIEFTSTTSTTVGASATRATESDTENEVASAEIEIKNCTFRGRLYVYDNFENQGKMTYSIHNCVFDGSNYSGDSNAYAIFAQCKGGNNLVIKDNAIAGFARGINIDNANVHATIEGNKISVTDPGRSCIQLSSLATADIVGNMLELTGGNAITLHEKLLTLGVVPEVSISGNTVTGTGYLVYDDAVANDQEFTSDSLKLTYATDNVVAETVNTTQGVKGSTVVSTSADVNNVIQHYVAQVCETGYKTLDAALEAVEEGKPLTWVSEAAWPLEKPVYYNGTFYETGTGLAAKGALERAIDAANEEGAAAVAKIYVRPGFEADELVLQAHQQLKTSLAIYGNDAKLSRNWEPCVEYPGTSGDSGAHQLTKDVSLAIYNLHNGAGFWGRRTTDYTVDLKLSGCQNAYQVMFYGNADTGVKGKTNITVTNCTFDATTKTDHNVLVTIGAGKVDVSDTIFTAANINVKNVDGGDNVITVKNSEFKDTVAGNQNIRVRSYVEGTHADLTIENVTFVGASTQNVEIGDSKAECKGVVSYTITQTSGTMNVYKQGADAAETTTLEQTETYSGNNQVVVAQVGETGYVTLEAAIQAAIAANNGVPVELLSDIDLTGQPWTPVDYQIGTLTIDGKGFTVAGLTGALLNKTGSCGHYLTMRNITFKDANIDSSSNYAAVIIPYADSMNELTFTNVKVVDSTVKGGNYAAAFVGYAAGYNTANDGPVFQQVTFTDCVVSNCTISGGGSTGALMGHASGNVNARIVVTGTAVKDNSITCTGTSSNKAGSLFGTIGSAGPTGGEGRGIEVSATTHGNTVKSGGTVITTIYGRQGEATGKLLLTAGGSYEASPIADADSTWATCAAGYELSEKDDGTYGVVEVPVYVAQVTVNGVTTKYTTFEDALAAANAATDATITLLDDVAYATNGSGLWNITSSMTLDGGGHALNGYGTRSGNKTTLAINNGGSAKVAVTLKNLTIRNEGMAGRPIETRGNISSLTLENCEVTATGSGNNQGITIGGNQSSAAKVVLKNTIVDAGRSGYPYISFNPATVEISGGTLSGYCGMYFKGINGSTGSQGTVVTATGTNFDCPNVHEEGSNDFGVFVLEDDGITINLMGCRVNSAVQGTARQAVVMTKDNAQRRTQPCSISITGSETHVNGELMDNVWDKEPVVSVSGGTFTHAVAEAYCANGYIPTANADGTYGVKEGSYVAQIGETKYETLQAAAQAAKSGDTVTLLADVTTTTIEVKKSITIDGGVGKHTITVDNSVKNRAFQICGETETISVTLKNLNILNTGNAGRAICVYEKVGTVTVESCSFQMSGGGNTQPITIGGDPSFDSNIALVVKDSTIEAGNAGYGIILFHPTDVTIQNSTMTGWNAIYCKGAVTGSKGSSGSTVTATGSTFATQNIYSFASNDFAAFVAEDDNVAINLTSCTVKAEQKGSNNQFVFDFREGTCTAHLDATTIVCEDRHLVLDSGESEVYLRNCTMDENDIPLGYVASNATDGWIQLTPPAKVFYGWLEGSTVKGGYYLLETPFKNGWLMDGEFIILTKNVKLLEDVEFSTDEGAIAQTGGQFTMLFANGVETPWTVDLNNHAFTLPANVSVQTDVQTTIFSAPDGQMIVEKHDEAQGAYIYSVATPVAKIGSVFYATLAEALIAAKSGDTVTLLGDIVDAGNISLRAGVTLDGNGHRVTGNSCVCINVAGGTIKNVVFEDIHNDDGKLSAIYAEGLSGTATITGCTFDNCDWDAIQMTPLAGAVISITGNVFDTDNTDGIQQQRYVHIESDPNVDFSATVTGNIMKGDTKQGTLEVYYFVDATKVHVSRNYIEDLADICILEKNGANVCEMAYPLYTGLTSEGAIDPATLTDAVAIIKSTYSAQAFQTLQAAFDAAKTGDTVTLLSDITLTEQVNITKALDGLTLDGNGKTITCATTDDPFQSDGSALYFGNATDHLYCTGIKIKNLTMTGTARYAIFLCGGTTTEFTNVTISGNYYIAVNLYGTHGATMTNCHISNSTTGTDKYLSAIWSNVASANPLTLNNSTVDVIAINAYTTANTLEPKIFVMDGSKVGEIHTFDDGSVSGNKKLCVSTSSTGTYVVKEYDASTHTWVDIRVTVAVTLGGAEKAMPFPVDWLENNIGVDASSWTTAALEEKAANELAKWQCYLFGLNPSQADAKVVATAGQGTEAAIPLAVANADASASPLVTGGYVKVAYVLMGTNDMGSNDGTVWTQVATSNTRNGLAIPLTGATYKFYRVDVTVTSAEGN